MTEDYSRFGDMMAKWYPEYTWETLETTTTDGYVLTMFHIWLESARDGTKGPVLFQHGGSMDGSTWLEYAYYKAPPLHMADAGHDVYMANTRGTPFSQGHTIYSATDDLEAYWDFSFQDMALDVVAEAAAMFTDANAGKGWFFGYSQGTIQALVALAKYEDELANYFHRAVLLAPCTIATASTETDLSEETMNETMALLDNSIWVMPTDTWYADKQTICAVSDYWCDYMKSIGGNSWTISSKDDTHWAQCEFTQRFQEFVEDWSYPDNHEAPLFDLEGISQVAISLMVGQDDDICPQNKAVDLSERLSTLQNNYTFPGLSHYHYSYNADDDYVQLLMAELTEVNAGVNTQDILLTYAGASQGLTSLVAAALTMGLSLL